MAFTWFSPALLSLAAMLWSVTLSPTNPPTPEVEPRHTSLAGDLLIASPQIGDPRFWHAVILIVMQDDGGALGIIINRPVTMMPLSSLLNAMGLNGAGIKGSIRVFAGGPMEPSTGYVLHSADYHRSGTIEIDNHVAMTLSPNILLDIGHGRGPKKSLVAFGYAGWGPGQLAMELARGDWFITPETTKLVFDEKRDHVWDDAMARRTTPF
jgi:putative transcriptional regulator